MHINEIIEGPKTGDKNKSPQLKHKKPKEKGSLYQKNEEIQEEDEKERVVKIEEPEEDKNYNTPITNIDERITNQGIDTEDPGLNKSGPNRH